MNTDFLKGASWQFVVAVMGAVFAVFAVPRYELVGIGFLTLAYGIFAHLLQLMWGRIGSGKEGHYWLATFDFITQFLAFAYWAVIVLRLLLG
jgi:hypothetical protein